MSWIQTYTGRKFWPLDPRPDDVCIEDIAHALALKCRYTGHCREFYSIAQHSVMVSHMVPAVDALWGLLHDAGEAYLPDVASPIKGRCMVIPENVAVEFSVAERRILTAVAVHFDLRYAMPSSIAAADLCCLERERRQLMGEPPEEWATAKWWDGDMTSIYCQDWSQAEQLFLVRFNELKGTP
jgi:hypothetical protein